MFVYKKLKASDASITAFEAHKEFNINKDNTSSLGISLINSQYSSASRDTYSQFNLNNELQYFQLDHLFYNNSIFNIGNLNGGINYIDQQKRLYNNATILSISQKNIGSAIQKGTFLLDEGNPFGYTYQDDSKGNIIKVFDTPLIESSLGSNAQLPEKNRVFYIGPVKGFKHTDLSKDPKTGNSLVNPPTSYNSVEIDDSLFTNTIEYISCSFEHLSDKNCTSIQLENGYVKIPHNNKFNFSDEDFSISFFYKSTNTDSKYLIAKSKSKTIIKTPESNIDGSLKNTHGSSSLLQPTEVDAGSRFPFEITFEGGDNKINFSRSDGDITSFVTSSTPLTTNTLYHIACVRSASLLRIYIDGTIDSEDIIDNTSICSNEADLFIGTNPDISQNKLDNTSEGQISQISILNKPYSSGQASAITISFTEYTDSPYVGNIFYEQGLVTFTSPSTNNTFTTTTNFSDTILLNPTQYQVDGGDLADTIDLTFSGSGITFFNEEQTLNALNTNIFSNLITSSIKTEAVEGGGNITLNSAATSLGGILGVGAIFSSSFNEYNTYSELSSIFSAIPGEEGTNPGDLGVDNDSSSSLNNPLGANIIGVFLGENQTVTESIDILSASNSQEVIAETFPYTDTQISDTVFTFGNIDFGGYEFTNDGGAYVDNANPAFGYLMVSGTKPNGGYFQGMLRDFGGGGSQTINDQSYNTVEFSFDKNLDGSSYSSPNGLDQGNDFNTTYNWVEVLEEPEYGSLTFQVTGSFENISTYPGSGPGALLYARLRKSSSLGETTAWTILNGLDIGSDTGYTFQDSQGVTATVGDKFLLEVRVSDSIGTWLTSYQVGNRFLKVIKEAGAFSEGFKNKTTLQHNYSNPKTGSIYEYRLDGIITRPGGGGSYDTEFSNNNTIGLDQDINSEEVGVRVSLFQGNTLITSSLFPSSSGTSEQDFSYTHFTGNNSDSLRLFAYPGISSQTEPVFTGASQGFFIGSLATNDKTFSITEKSGSNILELNSGLSDQFTSSNNVSSQIIFGDTTEFIGPSTPNPVDIIGFVNDDPTKVLVDGYYFATSSFSATASLDRGNYISGSASIDIAGTKGIYRVDEVTVLPGFTTGVTPTPLNSTQKLKVQSKLNGSLLDTRYISGTVQTQNIFSADELELGLLDNTDNVSFEFTVVDEDNNLDTVVKDQGFMVSNITLRKITSSNEVSLLNGADFPDVDSILFESPHTGVGYANLPLNIGGITASIVSVSGDTATLDGNFFITSSIGAATESIDGPFTISASYDFDYTTGKEYYFDFTGDISQNNDGGSGEGVGVRVLDAGGNILSEVYNESGTTTLGPANLDIDYKRFTSPGTGKILLFVSGTNSSLYPSGIVTSSNINFEGVYGIGFNITARSGSFTSSGITVSDLEFTEGGNESNLLTVSSSHSTAGTLEPILTTGDNIFNIVTRSAEGNIELTQPLFITGSSTVTGSHPTQSLVGITVAPIPVNPLNTNSTVNNNMLGSIITYTDPNTGTTQDVQITSLEEDPLLGGTSVELNNGFGVFQVGTFESQQPQEVTANYSITTANEDITFSFKNTHLIFENEFKCTVEEDEFNFTLNPTARKYKSINRGELANFATGPNFKPYVTTIGLYNEEGELLVVGKLAQPVRMSDETDTTFIVRYDT